MEAINAGSSRRRRALSAAMVSGLAIAAFGASSANAAVYYSNPTTNTIDRAPDSGGAGTTAVAGLAFPYGLSIEGANGTTAGDLFWANLGTNSIGRAPGLAAADPTFIPSAGSPIGVATDDTYVYWANPSEDAIGRAELDGSNADSTFIQLTGSSSPLGVAVDGGFIYWTERGNSQIGRSNLAGTAVNQSFIQGLANLRQIDVNYEGIYWGNEGGGFIGRANLDGSGANQLAFPAPGHSVNGIEADAGYLYYTSLNDNFVGRQAINGAAGGANPGFITAAATGPNYPTEVETTDTVGPTCVKTAVRRNGPGGHDEADVTITDEGSGVASLTNYFEENGTSSFTPFAQGARQATFTETKIDQTKKTNFAFTATDVAGNSTRCN